MALRNELELEVFEALLDADVVASVRKTVASQLTKDATIEHVAAARLAEYQRRGYGVKVTKRGRFW